MADEMLEIVECPECNRNEYYGMMHMLNGHSYCRKCIYNIWEERDNYKGWHPGKHDYAFPLYSDGIDHTRR